MVTAVESTVDRTIPVTTDRTGRLDGPGRRRAVPGRHLVTLARPGHAVKNLIAVPLALADTPQWTVAALARTGWAVLAFTLGASVIYVINDIVDRRLDRAHPDKRHRPIAAGLVSVPAAALFAVALTGGLLAVLLTGPDLNWWPLVGYLGLCVAYSRWLKHLPLLDICVIAAGFVLRVLQGYAATGAAASGLLLTAVFSGCLVLILGKRRHELTLAGTPHRPALAGYTVQLADHLLGVTAALASISFLLYLHTDAPLGNHRPAALAVVVPLGLLAAFRYLQSVLVGGAGGDPIRAVLRDRMIVTSAVLCGAALTVAQVGARYPNLLTWMDR